VFVAEEQDADGVIQALTASDVLDLRGGSGQAALLRLRNALDRLAVDSVLEVRLGLTDSREDLTAWARLAGHHILAAADASDHVKLFIRKQTLTRLEAPDWGLRAPAGGTLRDWLTGRAGVVPEEAATYYGFSPRGAVIEPGSPAYPYTLNRRADVWAENLPELYEQAKAQQWNAATDIDWEALRPLPDAMERAVCQLMTFLAENEYAALYIPAKFIPRINAQYVEPVLFLATIVNDEARHIEAFTRRALANGGGLQYAAALTEWSLHSLLVQEDYFRSSFLLHVLGEGTFLDLLDFIERHAPDAVTADVVRRARLDEGRHVAYGIAHVRDVLRAEPAKAEELVAAAEERSAVLAATSGANPMVIEALATLAAGGEGASDLNRGFEAVQLLFQEMDEYRVRRMLQLGLERPVAEKISHLHTPNFM
jgi:TusA-related sulfurtransferase